MESEKLRIFLLGYAAGLATAVLIFCVVAAALFWILP